MRQRTRVLFCGGLVLLACCAAWSSAPAEFKDESLGKVARLISAYPSFLERIDGNALVWKGGTRMVIDDGRGPKPIAALLESPDIKDMFLQSYPVGPLAQQPSVDFDPGRSRNLAFFDRMYGDCHSGAAARNLVSIVWLPKKWGKRLSVTRVNGVAEKLIAISNELDNLPAKFNVFLYPSAGTYNCRAVAGTDRVSAHGYGIAIDLSTKEADYWRWAAGASARTISYRNKIPSEIVDVFERQGFIWGGKWYHYDTMHFEYRPELLATE